MNKKPAGISIIICCFNSEKRIGPTLEHILKQKYEGFPIEVILVDNASKDKTVNIAWDLWRKSEKFEQIPFCIIHERKPGLAYARMAGIQASKYAYALFCDDDNHLCRDYCSRAFEIMEKHSNIGVLGGKGIGKYEHDPPNWFTNCEEYFAIGSQAATSGDLTNTKGYVWGAGMVIRNEAWDLLYHLQFRSILSDRKGSSLSSGGDVEFCKAIRLLGYQIYYEENLTYGHEIPPHRVDWKKIKKMAYLVGKSSALLLPHELLFLSQNPSFPSEKMGWSYQVKKSYRWIKKRKRLLFSTWIGKNSGKKEELEMLYKLGFFCHLLFHPLEFERNMKEVKRYDSLTKV